jgi:hypothetical protein
MRASEERLPALSVEERRQMENYGIARVPKDSFHYREFRYTNLQDALAQAKREAEGRQRIRT